MGINKVFGYFIGLLIVLMCIIYIVNTLLLYNIKSDVLAAEQVMITYAQTNGGFVDSGSESFPNFYNRVIETYHLNGKVANVEFLPGEGIKVQKGDSVCVRIQPSFILIIPFSDKTITFTGNIVERTGISRLYRK